MADGQFIPRSWVFQEILDWWDSGKGRKPFCLLIGQSGMGKSWIAERLGGTDPAANEVARLRSEVLALHRCLPWQGVSTSTIGFAENLAEQLSRNTGGRYDAVVRTAEAPSVEGSGSSVSGSGIGVLITGFEAEDSSARYNRQVRMPLKTLAVQDQVDQRLIVVDGLELPAAREPDSIVDQLANSADTAPHFGYLLVFDTVAEVVNRFPTALTRTINLSADGRVDEDVRSLIELRRQNNDNLAVNLGQRPGLADEIVEKVVGSLKYSTALLDELSSRPLEPDEHLPIPDGILEYYLDYLLRQVTDAQMWDFVVPALGPVSVSSLGIPIGRLEKLIDSRAGVGQPDAFPRLQNIRALIAGTGAETDGYRPHDDALAEVLDRTHVGGRENPRRVPANSERQLIVESYLSSSRSSIEIEKLDQYGLQTIGDHLAHLATDTVGSDQANYTTLLTDLVTANAYHDRLRAEVSDAEWRLGEDHDRALRLIRAGETAEHMRLLESCARSGSLFAAAAGANHLVKSGRSDLIRRLAESKNDAFRRLGLAAMLRSGPKGAELLVDLVIDWTDRELHSLLDAATLLVSYRWHPYSPEPAQNVYDAVIRRLGEIQWRNWLMHPVESRRTAQALVDFVGKVVVLIYTNNCSEEQVVVAQTSDLIRALFTDVIPMRTFERFGLRGILERVAQVAVTRPLAEALDGLNARPHREQGAWFQRPPGRRDPLDRVIERLDPGVSLNAVEDDLADLMRSDYGIDGVIACLAVGVHSHADPGAAYNLLRRLFDEGEGRVRLWLLLSQATLFSPPAPRAAEVAQLTRRYLTENRDHFLGSDDHRFDGFEVQLLPAFLTARSERTSPDLRDFIASASDDELDSWLTALRAPGVYVPAPVIDAIDRAGLVGRAESQSADLLRFLGASAPEIVAAYVREKDLGRLVPAVSLPEDLEAHRTIRWRVGLFNNAVHQALRYPRMRSRILIDGARGLAHADSARDFARRYVPGAIDMLVESDYDLRGWTDPEQT